MQRSKPGTSPHVSFTQVLSDSWNHETRTGYQIIRILLNKGVPTVWVICTLDWCLLKRSVVQPTDPLKTAGLGNRSRRLKIEADGDPWKGQIKPKIRLKGHWLERLGFRAGAHVYVSCIAPGIIELRTLDTLIQMGNLPHQSCQLINLFSNFFSVLSQKRPNSVTSSP